MTNNGNALPTQTGHRSKRLRALWACPLLLVALACGIETSMASNVLCSPMTATLLFNGVPVAGAKVVRRYHWRLTDREGIDEVTSDASGKFALPQVSGRSLIAWLPHQPVIDQDIEVYVGEQKYEIWSGAKLSYRRNAELEGKPSPLQFELHGVPVTHEHIVARLVVAR